MGLINRTIAEIDSIRSLTGLPAEHFEDCGCCDLGYVDHGPVWFICPFTEVFNMTIREPENKLEN